MKLEKLGKIFSILGFIVKNPFCEAPDIRDFLGIKHESKLSKEEKRLYSILNKLEREEYIYKIPIKRQGSGGAQFKIKLSEKGFSFLSQLKSNKILPERFPIIEVERLKEDDPKNKGLNRILNVYASEVYDIIEDTVEQVAEKVLFIHFENFGLTNQTKVVNMINTAVSEIRDRTEQIAKVFF